MSLKTKNGIFSFSKMRSKILLVQKGGTDDQGFKILDLNKLINMNKENVF